MQNVRFDAIQQVLQKEQTDPSIVQIPLNIEGTWRMDETQPQFGGTVKLPSGKDVLFESDFPPFLGGLGRTPTPLQYCFWGGMACYASTFALTAAAENIEIRKLAIRTTGTIDFHQALGLNTNPPIQNLKWEIMVESPASQAELERLNQLAEERCPASWMMKNVVPFEAKVTKQ